MAKTSNAPATSPLSNAKGARPGAKGDAAAVKEKKVVVKRVPYRIIEEGKDAPPTLDGVPADFDRKKHLPLKKADFTNEWAFFEYRADLAERQAKRFRKEAEQSKKLGSTKDRVKAKRLMAMLNRIAALEAELAEDGIDVDALKAASQDEAPETVGESQE